jgi:hypothetical protein
MSSQNSDLSVVALAELDSERNIWDPEIWIPNIPI